MATALQKLACACSSAGLEHFHQTGSALSPLAGEAVFLVLGFV
jgi:hypothetical protein